MNTEVGLARAAAAARACAADSVSARRFIVLARHTRLLPYSLHRCAPGGCFLCYTLCLQCFVRVTARRDPLTLPAAALRGVWWRCSAGSSRRRSLRARQRGRGASEVRAPCCSWHGRTTAYAQHASMCPRVSHVCGAEEAARFTCCIVVKVAETLERVVNARVEVRRSCTRLRCCYAPMPPVAGHRDRARRQRTRGSAALVDARRGRCWRPRGWRVRDKWRGRRDGVAARRGGRARGYHARGPRAGGMCHGGLAHEPDVCAPHVSWVRARVCACECVRAFAVRRGAARRGACSH